MWSAAQGNLEGIWTNGTITPLERPAELAGKAFFAPEEAAAYEKEWRARTVDDPESFVRPEEEAARERVK